VVSIALMEEEKGSDASVPVVAGSLARMLPTLGLLANEDTSYTMATAQKKPHDFPSFSDFCRSEGRRNDQREVVMGGEVEGQVEGQVEGLREEMEVCILYSRIINFSCSQIFLYSTSPVLLYCCALPPCPGLRPHLPPLLPRRLPRRPVRAAPVRAEPGQADLQPATPGPAHPQHHRPSGPAPGGRVADRCTGHPCAQSSIRGTSGFACIQGEHSLPPEHRPEGSRGLVFRGRA